MANGHIYEMKYNWLHSGQKCNYVFHAIGIASAATAEQLTSVMFSGGTMGQIIKLAHSKDVSFTSCQVQRLYPDRGESHNRPFGPNPAGLVNTAAHPSFVAVYILWRTVLRGRRRTGKTYMGGVPTNHVTNGLLTTSGQSGYNAFISDMLARWGPSGTSTNWRLGCWSRVLSPDPDNPNPDAFRGFISGEISTVVSSQRKRKVGVGQ